MGELQCPARFVIVPPGFDDVAALSAGALAGERVAAVLLAAADAGRRSAAALAEALDVAVHDVSGVDVAPALAEASDRYRGETVLVVAAQPVAGLPMADSPLVVEYDEHGWRPVESADAESAGSGAADAESGGAEPAALPEPDHDLSDPTALFLGYLDFYRSAVARKVTGLSDAELRTSLLPSGWTPIELVKHLVYMERRWLRWGFAAEPVDDPWGDWGVHDRWQVGAGESLTDLLAMLDEGGVATRSIVEAAELSQHGAVGGRFGGEKPPPTLAWILFHVLQEYARHAGHLDIARELADGAVGE
ncbi:MAG TPA: DinB family protein [Jiangellaceae bacterium]